MASPSSGTKPFCAALVEAPGSFTNTSPLTTCAAARTPACAGGRPAGARRRRRRSRRSSRSAWSGWRRRAQLSGAASGTPSRVAVGPGDRPVARRRRRVGVRGGVDRAHLRRCGRRARAPPRRAPSGETQPANGAASSAHSKWSTSASGEEKVSDGLAPSASSPIAVSGGVWSTVQARSAGVLSLLPATSIARTRAVCGALGDRERVRRRAGGERRARRSSTGSGPRPSLAELKRSVAVVWFVSAGGPSSISVPGSPVSIDPVVLRGVGSALPALSTARTRNRCVALGQVRCRSAASAGRERRAVERALEAGEVRRRARRSGRSRRRSWTGSPASASPSVVPGGVRSTVQSYDPHRQRVAGAVDGAHAELVVALTRARCRSSATRTPPPPPCPARSRSGRRRRRARRTRTSPYVLRLGSGGVRRCSSTAP